MAVSEATLILASNPLDERDDLAFYPRVPDPRERIRQGNSLRRCQEFHGEVWRPGLTVDCRLARGSLEKERHRHLEEVSDLLQSAALIRLVPFSYFWTCWNVRPSASATSVWLIWSMSRRIRNRLPT
jgi:hypothetical protein